MSGGLFFTKPYNDAGSPAAGVYAHIPYCKKKCAYCSFVSSPDFSDMTAYVEALKSEITERGGGRADTVYIGGGTPSVLYRGALREILGRIREAFEVSDDAEITVECNPDSAGEQFFGECAAAGVNRISMGLQSSDDALLRAVGRPHTFRQFCSAVGAARRAGIENVSVDLMLGLPGQSLTGAERSVEEVLKLAINHVSVYSLTVEDGTPLFLSGYRPDEDLCADMYELVLNELKRAGVYRYEVSNFARPGSESRHNLKYWTMAPYVGLGAAAHSYDGKTRRANTSDLKSYMAGRRIESVIEQRPQDVREEMIMLSLRTSDGLDLELFRQKCGCNLLEVKAAEIERLKREGLIEIRKGRLRLTRGAFYLMNRVIVSLI